MNFFDSPKTRYLFVVVILLLTGLFGYFGYKGFVTQQPQASLSVEGQAFELQQKIEKVFPRDAHTAPFMVFTENEEGDVLTQSTLQSVLDKSNQIRNSEFGKQYLLNFSHPKLGKTDFKGFLTIADATNQVLKKQGSSLESVNNSEFEKALNTIFTDSRYQEYFQLVTSERLEYENGKWQAPAFQFYVQADNDLLGGGVFRRTVGSTESIINKEIFNREIESRFQPISEASFLGIGIDLNLTAEDEGYSFGVLLRNGLLILSLAALTGLMMRSVRIAVTAFAGLCILFVWIAGFPALTGNIIKSSLMTEVILPLAFMAIGIDFFVYVVRDYEEKRTKEGGNMRNSTYLLYGFSAVSTALLLACISDAIAFGANYLSAAEAVRSFALTGIFSALSAFIIMGVFSPLLLSIWDDKVQRVKAEKSRLSLRPVIKLILRNRRKVVAFLICVTAITFVGIFKINKGLTPEDFISKDSRFVNSININDRNWGNTRGERASILAIGEMETPEAQSALEQTAENLKNNELLAHHPSTNELVLPLGSWEVKEFGDEDKKAALLVVEITDTRNLTTIQEVKNQMEADVKPIEETFDSVGITGSPFTREESLTAVADSLTKTFIVALGLILAILLFVFRSIKFSLISLSPVVLVTLWTFGFMGLAGLDLNFITATIAAVSLGLGVDYTIHAVQSYREKKQNDVSAEEVLLNLSDTTLVASFVAFTSSTIGFLILATAPMPLFATYGTLGAIMVIFAFISTITTLPLLLKWVESPK
jgi:predicted RND superfamily exporter protein